MQVIVEGCMQSKNDKNVYHYLEWRSRARKLNENNIPGDTMHAIVLERNEDRHDLEKLSCIIEKFSILKLMSQIVIIVKFYIY